jgi:hypothetical protein
MNDSEQDWLEKELGELREIQAPETLLPKVMKAVEKRQAQQWWRRFSLCHGQLQLLRHAAPGFALALLLCSIVLNPFQMIGHQLLEHPWVRAGEMLGSIMGKALLETRIWHLPVMFYLGALALSSMIFLVLSIGTLHRIAATKS